MELVELTMPPLLLNETAWADLLYVLMTGGGILLGIVILVVSINRIRPNPPLTPNAFEAASAPKPSMHPNLRYLFRYQCQLNFTAGLTPSNPHQQTEPGRLRLVELTQSFVQAAKQAELVSLLDNNLYFIDLWAAHLLLEHAAPSQPTQDRCLALITAYATSPRRTTLAEEETVWLKNYRPGEQHKPKN